MENTLKYWQQERMHFTAIKGLFWLNLDTSVSKCHAWENALLMKLSNDVDKYEIEVTQ